MAHVLVVMATIPITRISHLAELKSQQDVSRHALNFRRCLWSNMESLSNSCRPATLVWMYSIKQTSVSGKIRIGAMSKKMMKFVVVITISYSMVVVFLIATSRVLS